MVQTGHWYTTRKLLLEIVSNRLNTTWKAGVRFPIETWNLCFASCPTSTCLWSGNRRLFPKCEVDRLLPFIVDVENITEWYLIPLFVLLAWCLGIDLLCFCHLHLCYLSVCLYTRVCMYMYLSAHPSVCLSVFLSACLYNFLSVYSSVYLSICLRFWHSWHKCSY